LASIEDEIAAHPPDLTTTKGRDAVASLAYKIARRKTALDDAGKALNADLHKSIKVVDVVRAKMRNALDDLRDKARKPLDDWEAAEQQRKGVITAAFERFAEGARVPLTATLKQVAGVRAEIEATTIDPAVFRDRTEEAERLKTAALELLDAARIRIEQAEADAKELAQLKAADEERKRLAQKAIDDAAEAERQRQHDARVAEAAAEQAREDERQRVQAAAAEEQRVRDQAAQAAIDEANEKTRLAEEALEAERQKQADEAQAQTLREQENARKAADQQHRDKIIREARDALVVETPLDHDGALALLASIANGDIPHVSIRF